MHSLWLVTELLNQNADFKAITHVSQWAKKKNERKRKEPTVLPPTVLFHAYGGPG